MTTRQRNTRQGNAVRTALQQAGGFCSAQDVYAALRATGATVGLSTVYRHLQALADEGAVDAIHTGDGETTYRFCGTGADAGAGTGRHHHHLVCRVCGRAEEIEGPAIEAWVARVASEHGYADVEHTIEFFGTCRDCAG